MSEKNLIQDLCQLRELKLGCFGCCQHNFAEKSILKRDIRLNTKRFHEHKDKLVRLIKISKDGRKSGICKFVIQLDDGIIGCPLHPSLNKGIDIRKGFCGYDFLCSANQDFNKWDSDTQDKFVEFIKSENLDFVDYSFGIITGSLLSEFQQTIKSDSE
jgi:hypothetical protein